MKDIPEEKALEGPADHTAGSIDGNGRHFVVNAPPAQPRALSVVRTEEPASWLAPAEVCCLLQFLIAPPLLLKVPRSGTNLCDLYTREKAVIICLLQ